MSSELLVSNITLWPGVASFVEFAIGISLLLAFYRVVRGPDHTDRVVVLDFMTGAIICLVLFHAIENQSSVYLAVALMLAVISFIGTVALARYLFNRSPWHKPHG